MSSTIVYTTVDNPDSTDEEQYSDQVSSTITAQITQASVTVIQESSGKYCQKLY